MTTTTLTHRDDCMNDGDCRPISGQWLQPSGVWVDEAVERLGEDAPWCRIWELAWRLSDD